MTEVDETFKNIEKWLEETTGAVDPVIIYCPEGFFDKVMARFVLKKKKPKPYYRRGRWE